MLGNRDVIVDMELGNSQMHERGPAMESAKATEAEDMKSC